MEPSSFASILADLVVRVPGAFAAVLVDGDGEAVDYTGLLEPFDLKLAGAHWQIILKDLRQSFADRAEKDGGLHGRLRTLVIRGEHRSFIAHALPDGYAIVLLLSRRAGFTAAARAFSICELALATEAGWRIRARDAAWFAVEIVSTPGGRPLRLRAGSREYPFDVLGKLAGASLGPREVGWRVRLGTGAEITLVREPGAHWYSDEPLEAILQLAREHM